MNLKLNNFVDLTQFDVQLEIRSVERGICPIATSTMNELFL